MEDKSSSRPGPKRPGPPPSAPGHGRTDGEQSAVLAAALLDHLVRLHRPVTGDMTSTMRGEKAVLRHLDCEEPSCSPGRLAQSLHLTSARIANILRSLEHKGLVERIHDSRDRRRVLVQLTGAGRDHVQEHRSAVVEAMASVLRELGDDGPELVRIVGRIRQLADAGRIPAPPPPERRPHGRGAEVAGHEDSHDTIDSSVSAGGSAGAVESGARP